MDLSRKLWWIRQHLSRPLRTLRRDGLTSVWQAACDRIQAWKSRLRHSVKTSSEYAFPFIEPASLADPGVPRVSVIIPVFNGLAYIQQCLTALYAHPIRASFEVLVIDQASTDGSREYLQETAAQHAQFHLIGNPVNVGFPRAVNQGAACARGSYLMIVNSDVILAPGCIDRLIAALDSDERLAVVSPVTNYVGRGMQVDPAAKTLQPADIITYAAQIANRTELIPIVDHLVFFCVLLRRDTFELLNGMSEVYALGNYEDNDFCLRARLAGHTLALVPGAFAYHFGSRTFKGQNLAHTQWMERNERLYYERASHLSRTLPRLHRPGYLNSPRLTVIVDGRADHMMLFLTLNSLAHQTVTCFDVVLVGDAVMLEVAMERFAGILSLSCSELQIDDNVLAWNHAHKLVRGDWVVCVCAGDVLYPTHIEMLLSLTKSNSHVVSTQVNAVLFASGHEQLMTIARAPYIKGFFDPKLIWAEPVLQAPAFAYQRACVSEVGEFDTEKAPLADWDFLLRLLARYPLSWVDTITAERCVYMGTLTEIVDNLPRVVAEHNVALHTVHACHPAPDASVMQLRSQVVTECKQKLMDLKWLAAQQWDLLSVARQMASVWLSIGE